MIAGLLEGAFVKPAPTYQKLRGGYYTPKSIANFLARWAIRSPEANILEPSCGDGILLESAVEVLLECGAVGGQAVELVHGVELDPLEAAKALRRLHQFGGLPFDIHVGDFFSYCKEHLAEKRLFDVVIGNPPFVRYQNFPEDHRTVAFDLMRSAGLHPNRLTNSWVPFLVAITLLLNEKGRMAMVIPAELLQVNYAAELRQFLSQYYTHITLVTFKKLVFEDTQQEVVLLLGERSGGQKTGIRAVELNGIDDLNHVAEVVFSNGNLQEKTMNHSTEKWTMYFLDEAEIQLLRNLKTDTRLTTAHTVIDVDVGIVTGMNNFFVVSGQRVKELSLEPYTQSLVGRSTYLQGAIFSIEDWMGTVER